MLWLLTPFAVAIPTYLYLRVILQVDRFEREPLSYLLGAFLWGALPAVIFALGAEAIFGAISDLVFGKNAGGGFIQSAVVAPIVEELLKALAVLAVYAWRKREFDGWVDGLVYGATVGFGFAYVENILYIAGTATVGEWISLFVLRVVILGFMHGFWTSLTGIGFGIARFRTSRFEQVLFPLAGLLGAILLHMTHNGALALSVSVNNGFILFSVFAYALMIVLMLALGRISKREEQRTMRRFLLDEVGVTLTPATYAFLCGESKFQGVPTPPVNRRVTQYAAELAQKKRQALFRPDAATLHQIGTLRNKLAELPAGV